MQVDGGFHVLSGRSVAAFWPQLTSNLGELHCWTRCSMNAPRPPKPVLLGAAVSAVTPDVRY